MIKELYISELIKPLANQSVMLNEEFGDCAILPDFDSGNKFTINLIDFLFVNFLMKTHISNHYNRTLCSFLNVRMTQKIISWN